MRILLDTHIALWADNQIVANHVVDAKKQGEELRGLQQGMAHWVGLFLWSNKTPPKRPFAQGHPESAGEAAGGLSAARRCASRPLPQS